MLAVKDNQPQVHAAIRDSFDTARAADFRGIPVSYFEETGAGHGRCEVRRCWLIEDLRTLPDPQQWRGLRSIALIDAERHQGEVITRECRHCITTPTGDARQIAHAARAHWGIENSLHWVLYATFREDDSRIRRDPSTLRKQVVASGPSGGYAKDDIAASRPVRPT